MYLIGYFLHISRSVQITLRHSPPPNPHILRYVPKFPMLVTLLHPLVVLARMSSKNDIVMYGMQYRSTLFIAFIICATDFVAPSGSVHIQTNFIGVHFIMISQLSIASWNWSYPEYRSLMEYIARPTNASANLSTIGPTLEFRIMTLVTGCKS